MSHFQALLRDINARLPMAQPLKSHILMEIAGDLDDMYRHYRAQGMPEDEAADRATERLDISDEALEDLVQVHQSFPVKLSTAIHNRLQSRWEAVLLMLSLLALFIFVGKEVLTMRIFENASLFIWPILMIAGLVILQVAVFAYVLYVRKNPNIRKMRFGIRTLLILGGMSLFIGFAGYFAELFLADNYLLYLGPLFIMLLHEGRTPGFVETLQQMPLWYIKGAALMMCSLSVSLLSGVLWHLLFSKLHNVEQQDLATLLDDE